MSGSAARVTCRRVATGLAVALVAAGCGRGATDSSPVVVFAAASLNESFTEMAARFEAANPGSEVSLAFAGSQILRLQIEHGAPAHVFASANAAHMEALARGGQVGESRVFAQNELVVIVPRDNPAGIESFADLPRARRIVLGAEEVPIGAYTRQLLRRAGERLGAEFESAVWSHTVSEESNVRLVRAKVELGEADAAIVFRTDAMASERVRSVAVPAELAVRTDYFIGRVEQPDGAALAQRFVDFVLSEPGRQILVRQGFLVAP